MDDVRKQTRETARGLNEQARAAKEIEQSAAEVARIAAEVTRSTGEQGKSASLLASSGEEVRRIAKQTTGAVSAAGQQRWPRCTRRSRATPAPCASWASCRQVRSRRSAALAARAARARKRLVGELVAATADQQRRSGTRSPRERSRSTQRRSRTSVDPRIEALRARARPWRARCGRAGRSARRAELAAAPRGGRRAGRHGRRGLAGAARRAAALGATTKRASRPWSTRSSARSVVSRLRSAPLANAPRPGRRRRRGAGTRTSAHARRPTGADSRSRSTPTTTSRSPPSRGSDASADKVRSTRWSAASRATAFFAPSPRSTCWAAAAIRAPSRRSPACSRTRATPSRPRARSDAPPTELPSPPCSTLLRDALRSEPARGLSRAQRAVRAPRGALRVAIRHRVADLHEAARTAWSGASASCSARRTRPRRSRCAACWARSGRRRHAAGSCPCSTASPRSRVRPARRSRSSGRDSEGTIAARAARAAQRAPRGAAAGRDAARSGRGGAACLDDPTANVRALGGRGARAHRLRGRHAPLFVRLADESPRVAHAASAAIQALGSSETERLALEAAHSPLREVRRAALRILAYFGYESGLPLFAAALREHAGRRTHARRGGAGPDPARAARSARAAVCHQPERRRQAARGRHARARPGRRRTPTPGRACRLGSPTPTPGCATTPARRSAGRDERRRHTDAIVALLSDPAGQVRVAAIEALSHLTGDAALSALRQLLRDADDPDVRRAALLGLGLWPRHRHRCRYCWSRCAEADAPTRLIALSALVGFIDDREPTRPRTRPRATATKAVRTAAVGFLQSCRWPRGQHRADRARCATGREQKRALDALVCCPRRGRRADAVRCRALLRALDTSRRHARAAARLLSVETRRGSLASDALLRALPLPNRLARLVRGQRPGGARHARGVRCTGAGHQQRSRRRSTPRVRAPLGGLKACPIFPCLLRSFPS